MFVFRMSSDEYGDLLKYVPGWIGQLLDVPLRCTLDCVIVLWSARCTLTERDVF